MLGLIKKDTYYLKSIYYILFVLGAVGILMPIFNFPSVPMLYPMLIAFSISVPLTLGTYDEQCGWDSFGNTFPISRSKTVISRYISILIYICLAVGILLTTEIVSSLMGHGDENALLKSALMFALNIFFTSPMIPCIYKFSVQKARYIFIGICAALTACCVAFVTLILSLGDSVDEVAVTASDIDIVDIAISDIPIIYFAIVGILITVGIYLISMLISISVYKKKEL